MQNTSTSNIYEQKCLAGLHDISIFSMITESQAKRNKQKLFNANQRISIKSNKLNIGRQGRGVVKDTRGQGRLRKAHTTVTISFEIICLSISLSTLSSTLSWHMSTL